MIAVHQVDWNRSSAQITDPTLKLPRTSHLRPAKGTTLVKTRREIADPVIIRMVAMFHHPQATRSGARVTQWFDGRHTAPPDALTAERLWLAGQKSAIVTCSVVGCSAVMSALGGRIR